MELVIGCHWIGDLHTYDLVWDRLVFPIGHWVSQLQNQIHETKWSYFCIYN